MFLHVSYIFTRSDHLFFKQKIKQTYFLVESPVNVNPQSMGSIHSVNLNAIARHTFIPDYTVRAVTEVFYVKIKRSLYLAAKRATLLERSQKDISPSTDQFDDEVEKVNFKKKKNNTFFI